MNKSALFVFIEGADGVGKSSIMNAILKNFVSSKLRISATHLIKHTRVGTAFYQEWTGGAMTGLPAALAMLGSTVATLEDISKAKDNYDIVLVDRSQASFFAYQLSDKGLRKLLLPAFEETLEAGFYKECNFATIYLTCDSNIAKERMLKSRGTLDAIESKGSDYQETVKQAYSECFKTYYYLLPTCIIDTGANDQEASGKLAVDFVNQQFESRTK
ncbi:MAG: hypothetical protein RR877_00755 [Aurantimicrobium sp.]|uniref:dTMP kinase n=1 Tax=Aurantimicrobium sp. TaxID=1930784 RepID=UPI002FC662FE